VLSPGDTGVGGDSDLLGGSGAIGTDADDLGRHVTSVVEIAGSGPDGVLEINCRCDVKAVVDETSDITNGRDQRGADWRGQESLDASLFDTGSKGLEGDVAVVGIRIIPIKGIAGTEDGGTVGNTLSRMQGRTEGRSWAEKGNFELCG